MHVAGCRGRRGFGALREACTWRVVGEEGVWCSEGGMHVAGCRGRRGFGEVREACTWRVVGEEGALVHRGRHACRK